MLFIIASTSVLKISLKSSSLTGELLTNSNRNMPLVLKRNPPAYVVVSLSSYGSRHLAAVL